MAIINVRTELKVGTTTGVKTSAIWHLSNGTASGESHVIKVALAAPDLGRAVAGGDYNVARDIPQAVNIR